MEPRQRPDARGPESAVSDWAKRALALQCVLAVPASGFTLYYAQEFLVPICAAVLLAIVLAPLLRWTSHLGVPRVAGALLVALLICGSITAGTLALAEPITNWTERLPSVISEANWKLRKLMRPVEKVKKASEKVDDLARATNGADDKPAVVVKSPTVMERLLQSLRAIGWHMLIMVVLLVFLLSSSEPWRERLASLLPRPAHRQHFEAMADLIEADVSRYVLTITLINLGFGTCVGSGLYLLGFPNAVLWGAMAGCLNFVPYAGVVVGAGIVGMVGLVTVPDTTTLAALGVYLGLNLIESQLVTPAILGRRFALDPVAVFLSILFWGWLWSIPGALMAVPFLLLMRAVCCSFDGLKPLARLIAGGAVPEVAAASRTVAAEP